MVNRNHISLPLLAKAANEKYVLSFHAVTFKIIFSVSIFDKIMMFLSLQARNQVSWEAHIFLEWKTRNKSQEKIYLEYEI